MRHDATRRRREIDTIERSLDDCMTSISPLYFLRYLSTAADADVSLMQASPTRSATTTGAARGVTDFPLMDARHVVS